MVRVHHIPQWRVDRMEMSWFAKPLFVGSIPTHASISKGKLETQTLRRNKMSKLDELYTQMNDLFTDFSTNHQTNINTGNKAAGTRARKAIGEVKKLVTEYRKASVEASK